MSLTYHDLSNDQAKVFDNRCLSLMNCPQVVLRRLLTKSDIGVPVTRHIPLVGPDDRGRHQLSPASFREIPFLRLLCRLSSYFKDKQFVFLILCFAPLSLDIVSHVSSRLSLGTHVLFPILPLLPSHHAFFPSLPDHLSLVSRSSQFVADTIAV